MSNRFKKLNGLLAIIVVAVSIFTGCGKTEEPALSSSVAEESSSVVEESPSTVVEEEFSYPIEPNVYLTINLGGTAGDRNTENRPESGIGVFDALTGVVVEDNNVSMSSDSDDFLLMLIKGELPDIICNQFNETFRGGASAAMDQGYIIALNDYEEYMPNYLAWLEEHPMYAKQVTTEDGRIWAFAGIEDQSEQADCGITIRKDILDALGMEIPTTIGEFYEVLKAVKTNYPDMIPFSAEMRWMYSQSMSQAISGAYGACYPYYTTDGTTVEYALYDDDFRDWLQTMNEWYSESLIDPGLEEVTEDDIYGKLASGELFSALQQSSDSALAGNECEIEGAEFVAIPFLTLEEGATRYNFQQSAYVEVNNFFSISTDCENVEAAIRYCDYLFSRENSLVDIWQTGLVNAGVTAPMTDDEVRIYDEYADGLDTYAQKKIKDLILGTESFDNWEKIQSEARSVYHADEVLAVMQSSWDSFIQ